MKSLTLAAGLTGLILYCLQRPALTRLLTIRRRPASNVRPLSTARRRRS